MECFDREKRCLVLRRGLYPEVAGLLHDLSAVFRLGVASHSPDPAAGMAVLRCFKLDHLFQQSLLRIFRSKSKVDHLQRCASVKLAFRDCAF